LSDESRLHAVVHGDVQGVGYRYFVQRAAWSEGLTGWVRNRYDGAVECVAQGPREAVERLLAKLRRGPAMSSVDRVDASWEQPQPGLTDFDVLS
jgi:acylphosphatase